MRKLLLLIALILALFGAVRNVSAETVSAATIAPAHAIIPNPTTIDDYCAWYGGNRLIRCWCDEYLRYPICKRWHWHRGEEPA